ncbi:atp4 subunit B of the stator stalk of mitochondrial F1F0 ATP synthase [Mortierella sp. GBA35]|nr:atp4 subunit B of the stator stalk of mitochondrial F1F0 ATP synthase [Mortierella sp. AD031]KAF9106256.1 atp4 subunit B of the stator stalk of mitochondrial F1F0 ATP synthase [Mortierella sp. GBA35]KAG0217460.1 atp4 subunit B of the stator stalk of mitochondrial F1F0 ATP synthase [Mortierella sp. NVP41]
MALRLLTKSASVAAVRPMLAAQRSTASVAIRHMATSAADEKQVSPESKAQSILDALPGNSLVTKTGVVTALAGLSTYLISQELYIFNEETLVLLAFAATFGGIVKSARAPFNEWADGHINKIRSILEKARVDHKAAVAERIDQVGQMKDVVEVTQALYALSKETAKLEADAFELKQKTAMTTEVKAVLDSWVRYETSVREREQHKLAAYMIEKIKADLQDPKLQAQILEESISQVEKIASSKA